MSERLILRGARVIDPVNRVDAVGDLGVADGILVPASELGDCEVLDLTGLVVAPGFIDAHVHLRDPGLTEKEDMSTGSRAAAAGGFTTVVAMPNTRPVCDSPAVLGTVFERIRQHAVVRVLPTAAMSLAGAGRDLTDMAALKKGGAVAVTDDGRCIQSSELFLNALRQARLAGLPVIDHCEIEELAGNGAMHAGECAVRLGVPGKIRSSEELAVARNILLAREAGWPVHMQHLSSAGSVALVRWARQTLGLPVTAEATPHHLALTDAACLEYGTNAKMNPPLREESDRQALLEGLRDGTITVIATDHAPHTAMEKAMDFTAAPFGIIGLETAVGICFTELYHGGILSLSQLVSKFTQGPREMLGIEFGTLSLGAVADVTVLDVEQSWTVDINRFQSKSRNCPYHGWNLRGRAVRTMVGGRWVWGVIFPPPWSP